MFLGMQAALFYHARTVAIAAAQEGARAAGGENGEAADGVSAASAFIADAGGDDVLSGASATANRTADDGHRDCDRAQSERDPGLEPGDHAVGITARGEADGTVSSRMLVRDERGSASVEAAVGLPAFVLFVGLIIFGGRTATTHQAVESAAADAARSASIARTSSERKSRRQGGRAGEPGQPGHPLPERERRRRRSPTSASRSASRAPSP